MSAYPYRRMLSATLAMLCLGGCGWTRQKVAELLDEAGGKQGDPAKAAKSFAKLGEFVGDKDPGPPPVRAAAMEAMATIALDHDYRSSDPAAWALLGGLLDSELQEPHLPVDEVKAGGPGVDADRAALQARALWNLGRLDSREHIPAAIRILADDAASAELHRAAIDLLARESGAVAGDGDAHAAAVLALAHRLGAEPGFEPASTGHLVGVLVDLPTLIPLVAQADGATRVVTLRWLRQLLGAAAATRDAMPEGRTEAIRTALLDAATTDRPAAEQARAALMRWSPAAWAAFCLGGQGGKGGPFQPAERCADLAVLLPDLDALARAAARPGGGDGWSLLRDGLLVLDERAALAPGPWKALQERMVGRVLEQAGVADPAQADQLCAAVLHTAPTALAVWFDADPKARPPAFAVRYLAALAADPAVTADAALRTRTWQALASLLAVADAGLRQAIGGVLIGRDPALLADTALGVLAHAEAEAPPACTALAEVALAAVIAAPQAKPDLAALAVVFRRGLPEVLPAARALLVHAAPALLADLTLAERYARNTADAVDAQILADLLQSKAVDGERAAAVADRLRQLVDGPDEDAAVAAAACLVWSARHGGAALPASHWTSVQRLAALAAQPASKPN